ncbi:MAG: leucyl aminopeptidase family protein [Pseudomonadota bacterium]
MLASLADSSGHAIALRILDAHSLESWLTDQPDEVRAWVTANGFSAKSGSFCPLPDRNGHLSEMLAGVEAVGDIWSYGALPKSLPPGTYEIQPALDREGANAAALGWALGSYSYNHYRKVDRLSASLVWPQNCDTESVKRLARGIGLTRDLINTPANDMGPEELEEAARQLAGEHGAALHVTEGEALLEENYPAIHAVGRASTRAPRLIDLRWSGGDQTAPLIVLVGKGVCFDTGGLDLKPAEGMKIMKKDMGGAAHVLGLASTIMEADLPVRLRVLIPAVENAVSGNAFRPMDVIQTRKGLSVEIGNTDAEGRLVLADALCEAGSEKVDLLLDFATLTGAARVALGPDLPAMFCNDEALASSLTQHGERQRDSIWRLPLHQPYREKLKSKVADLNNVSEDSFAGAITAALFLEHFIPPETPWVHFDIYAWNQSDRPGRPAGGEAMVLRAVYSLIEERALSGKSPSNDSA